MLRSTSLALLLLAAACGAPSPGLDAGLDASSGFDAGGLADAGKLDGGWADAGLLDAGVLDAGPADGGSADAGQLVTVVRVHYPAGTRQLSMRGSAYPFTWAVGTPMTLGANDTWTFTTTLATGTLEFKPLLDDTNWSRGPNYTVQAGTTVDIFPHFFTTNGQWSKRWSFTSTLLNNTRPVWVYLPPTYVENARARFPVVYMHDGQNLFDPNVAFGGNPWWAQNAIDAAAENGAFREAIIVGPEATANRMGEYTPTPDPSYGGGNGLLYLRMLVEELKPKADAELRTLPGREHTVIIGSSLGGLISSYAGTVKATTFGMVGAMSPSTWWDGKVLLSLVAATPASPRPLRVYVDSGDSGTSYDDQANTAQLAQAYRTLGYSEPATLKYVVQAGATHSEVYWAQRLPKAFEFLLGPRQ